MATPSSIDAAVLPGNLKFSDGGIYTDDLIGSFIKSASEDAVTGVVSFVVQDANGFQQTINVDAGGLTQNQADARVVALVKEFARIAGTLVGITDVAEAIRYGLIVFTDRNPTESDFANHRLFFDGIEMRKVRREGIPGHDRIVNFREDNLQISQYGDGIYVDRRAADAVPGTPSVGQRYYNRNRNHWEIWETGSYWDTSQFIAAPQDANGSLWIGEFGNENLADAHVDRVGEIASYPNDSGIYVLHRVDTIVAQTEDDFRYELEPAVDGHALDNDEIDNDESDVQGTVSGRSLARAVDANERFTDVEQDILDDLSRITYPHPTDDWRIRQTYFVTDFFSNRYSTFLSLGWDADNRLRALSGDGHVGRLGGHDRGRIYDGSDTLRGGLISGVHWLYLRDNGNGSAIVRAPVDGGDSEPEFQIILRYFSIFADPDSGSLIGILRRISATDMEVGLLSYDDSANTITVEDTITLTLPIINNALGSDFVPLTNIHHETATGVYQGVAGALLEGDTLYLLLTDLTKTDSHTTSALVGYTLSGTPNNRTLTVLAENAVDELPISDELTSAILPLEADELFIARDTSAYRLAGHEESDITTDDTLSGEGTEDDPLAVASPYPGPVTWPTLSDRPDRPTADEIIAGTGVDESVPSPSDIVALANAHSRNARSNTDPENIAEASAEGTAPEVSRGDHVHALPIDDTLEFDSVSGDLGVSIHDVIQHLQEDIRYYTDSIDHPADPGGHSAGQMYRTGPFPTTISRVQSQIDVLFGHPSYAARIYRVDSDRNIEEFLGESSHFVPLSNNPHSYDFTVDDGIGIPIPASSFIVILFHAVGGVLIPLRTGDEASDSPGESYQDANRDFNMVHSVVYDNVHPSVGDDTASHDGNDHIRGNIKIFYDIAYDHGNLLGGTKANTDLQNIDEDLTDDEKEVVRTRIGVGEGKVDTDLQNIDDDLTVVEQDAVATDVGVVREPRAWATATTFEAGWMATRNGNLYIAVTNHVSSVSNEPGTNGGSDEWVVVRQVGEIQYAAGRYYQPGMVVANGGSSQIYICRRPTTNEPSAMNDNWLWLPYGAYTLEAETTAHRYRRGNLIFAGSEVYFCHTTPPNPGLTSTELATSPLYITRLSSYVLTQDEIEDPTSDAQGTVPVADWHEPDSAFPTRLILTICYIECIAFQRLICSATLRVKSSRLLMTTTISMRSVLTDTPTTPSSTTGST